MSTPLYFLLIQAVSTHWTSHENKYPLKMLLTPAQHQALCDYRYMASTGLASAEKAPKAVAGEKFMGVPILHDANTLGVLIDVNGIEIPV